MNKEVEYHPSSNPRLRKMKGSEEKKCAITYDPYKLSYAIRFVSS
jgi:hypothetical protein